MNNVFAAIQNRDAGAMARMMGPDNHHDQQDNVVNISAERLVDALFKQLKQLFPAAEQTNLKTVQQETDAKRQWITAKATIKSMSTRDDGNGARHDASLQITDMSMSPASGEPQKTTAQTLYGGEDD